MLLPGYKITPLMPEKNNLDEKTIIANVADWQLITIHNNKTGDLMTLKYNSRSIA